MKTNSSFPVHTPCDTDLHPFPARAIWVLLFVGLGLVCASRRNDSPPPCASASQNAEPKTAGASVEKIQLPGRLAPGLDASAHDQVSLTTASVNWSAESDTSAAQAVEPHLPVSAEAPAAPSPQVAPDATSEQSNPSSPQLVTDAPAPLTRRLDDDGTGQPCPEQVRSEPGLIFEAPDGARAVGASARDDSITPVAPGLLETVSPNPFLNSARDANGAESEVDRTWYLSIQLALHDTNVAHLVVEEARADRIPDAAWLSILVALLGQPVQDDAQPATSLSASSSLTAEDLVARIDLAQQLALVVPKAARREALEQVCLSLARQLRE